MNRPFSEHRYRATCISQLRRFCILAIAVTCVTLPGGGCNREKANPVSSPSPVANQSLDASADVAERVPANGRTEIQLTPPVELDEGYVRLYVIGDGRPSVVQFTSYEPERGPETYPALLIRATTSVTSIDQLADQELTGHVFFQQAADELVLSTSASEPVPITIAVLEGQAKTMAAVIGGVNLLDPMGQSTPLTGIAVEGLLP